MRGHTETERGTEWESRNVLWLLNDYKESLSSRSAHCCDLIWFLSDAEMLHYQVGSKLCLNQLQLAAEGQVGGDEGGGRTGEGGGGVQEWEKDMIGWVMGGEGNGWSLSWLVESGGTWESGDKATCRVCVCVWVCVWESCRRNAHKPRLAWLCMFPHMCVDKCRFVCSIQERRISVIGQRNQSGVMGKCVSKLTPVKQ